MVYGSKNYRDIIAVLMFQISMVSLCLTVVKYKGPIENKNDSFIIPRLHLNYLPH